MQGQEAAKQSAEQRFWLPLERTGGRRAGELCVSFLLCKVGWSLLHQPAALHSSAASAGVQNVKMCVFERTAMLT